MAISTFGNRSACEPGGDHRVEGRDPGALGVQASGEDDGGRFAQVVGVRLEGESQQGDVLAAQAAQTLLELADHAPLLQVVDLDHGVQELKVIARVAGELLERLHVFGKARAAVADAGLQELRADAVVETHAAATKRTSAPTASQSWRSR